MSGLHFKERKVEDTPFFTSMTTILFWNSRRNWRVTLPSGTEMVMPGDDGKFTVKLITPIAMTKIYGLQLRGWKNSWSWSSN